MQQLNAGVETDANAAPDGRLFAPVNYSLERLEKLAKERGVAVKREVLNGELVRRPIFGKWKKSSMPWAVHRVWKSRPPLNCMAASGKRQEVYLAAARMRRLAAEGEDVAQMAVVYPKQSGYGPLLQNILPMYGLSAYVAEKRQAGAHPLSRFILSALTAISGNWRLADILECAQSGFLGLSQDALDRFCVYCEGADVRGDAMRQAVSLSQGRDRRRTCRAGRKP